jgi:hypothetical protein
MNHEDKPVEYIIYETEDGRCCLYESGDPFVGREWVKKALFATALGTVGVGSFMLFQEATNPQQECPPIEQNP